MSMTKQESFKRRIRRRMADTGERYVVARQALMDKAATRDSQRRWIAPPEMSDDAIRSGTGKGWDEWCDVIDRFPGRTDGHKAIADHVRDDLGLDGWWAQGVTVGYERITGLRLPHQMADGSFTANKSRTVTVDGDELRHLLLDDDGRAHLFPDVATSLRSKPTAKALRLAVGPGVATVSLEDRGDGRTKVTIAHERLPAFADVEEWKFYWAAWLDAIDEPAD